MSSKSFYIFASVLLSLLFNSCYFNRPLKQVVNVRTVFPDSVALAVNTDAPKYIKQSSNSLYNQNFQNSFNSQLHLNNIFVVTNDSIKPTYTIVIKNINLSESSGTKEISDTNSSTNGSSYELHKCNVSSTFYLVNLQTRDTLLGDYSTEKSEDYTNNRSFWQIVFGQNKDNSTYRYTELNPTVFKDLSEKNARKACALITHGIRRESKKEKKKSGIKKGKS